MIRELAALIADRARYVAVALLAAAALADLTVWVYDSGRAEALAERLAAMAPPTEEDPS